MTALVLGAGFIGSRVVHALGALGEEVFAASRAVAGPRGVWLDRRDPDRVRALVRDRRISTVVDMLAYTRADTVPLLEALDGEIGRWVMASSCDVYRNYEGLHRQASPEPILGPLGEGSPLRTLLHPYRRAQPRPADAPDAWMDDYDKIPLEQALRARPGLSGVILRLPMVFGPGDRQHRFGWLLAPMLKSKPRITVDPAWAGWRTTYGYVDDVAHALATAVLHPAASGRTFNLGERGPPDHRGWIDRYASVLAWRGEVVIAPAASDGPLAGLDLRYPLEVDTRAFRDACGWIEPTSLTEALLQTAGEERARLR